MYQPNFVSVEMDDNGVVPASVVREKGEGAKLFYALPNFPKSNRPYFCRSERRQELVETCARMGIPLIEDNPGR